MTQFHGDIKGGTKLDSILNSTKKMLGLTEDYEHFDQDIIMHINSVFMILNQIGIGPSECFSIKDSSSTWDEFKQGDETLESVKTYMYMKVRTMFDPPQSSVVMEATNKVINELEFRLKVAADLSANKNSDDSE